MLKFIEKIIEKRAWQEVFVKSSLVFLRDANEKNIFNHDLSEAELKTMIQRFAISHGERLDPIEPFASGYLDEISARWVAIIPPVAVESEFILRKQAKVENLQFEGYDRLALPLRDVFLKGNHLLIAGLSGYGKTTLLKKILGDFFYDDRVIILDTFQEWSPSNPRWSVVRESTGLIDGRGRKDMRALFSMALRMSADRFVLGEIRDREKKVFRELCRLGHGSVISTIHGSNMSDLIYRLGSLPDCHVLFIRPNYQLHAELISF